MTEPTQAEIEKLAQAKIDACKRDGWRVPTWEEALRSAREDLTLEEDDIDWG